MYKLPPMESEGYDREHLKIPENHRQLIEAVAEVQSNIIVVLSNGAPIEMPWLNIYQRILLQIIRRRYSSNFNLNELPSSQVSPSILYKKSIIIRCDVLTQQLLNKRDAM